MTRNELLRHTRRLKDALNGVDDEAKTFNALKAAYLKGFEDGSTTRKQGVPGWAVACYETLKAILTY